MTPWMKRSVQLRLPARRLLAVLLAGIGLAQADSVVVFNEIQYHPWDPAGAEWIELHNQMAVDVDLSQWRLRGGVDYEFAEGTVIPAGGYLLVSGDPVGLGVAGALGPWLGSLSNNGERLRLRNNSGRLMDEVEFGDRGVWPIGPDGSGATLAKIDEDGASNDPANWRASPEVGGTPGRANPASETTATEIVLVPIDATWRYNESGADLGAGWAGAAHPDDGASWFAGAGLIAFETTPEALPEPIGTTLANSTANEIITYYFEVDFSLSASQLANLDSLSLRHVIDDGAVFYLNGAEVGPRFNMASGVVSASTPANTRVRNAEYVGPLALPSAALVPGSNLLSVEVHQELPNSNDVVFGAELSMTESRGAEEEAPLLISEIAGTGEAVFQVEIANSAASAFDAGRFVIASRGSVDASYPLPSPTPISGNGFLVLDEIELGFRPGNGDRLFLFTPGREALTHAARADDLPRAWSAGHGRLLVPSESSFGEPNAFAINTDVVLNEIMYHFREDPGTEEGRNPPPIIERDEEWVELFNKGPAEVELDGWSLDGGIDFVFPPGASIPAGGYLVIAKDAAALSAKHPALAPRIVGDFRNRLNNRRDLIRLEDAVENPVDEVRYWDGGRWPKLADGRGSSLELRDPDADNRNPAAWAASDESGKENWQTITYRDAGGQSYGLSNWNEFRLGMLQAGEVLIDDVSVLRDPDGAREELIQNGSFTAGANRWRLLGNHGHSGVIAEPGNPGNQALHLIATGPHDTRHNHLETTLRNNTAISAGQTYEVSFRARWLAGSNLLNSRCYYQRLAHTTSLNRPENCGTPGAANSRREVNIGPTFSRLRHDPPVPPPNTPIEIRADFADPDGLASFVLKARYDEGPMSSHSFSVDTSGRGAGTLPGASAGTVIQFWIEAADALGAGSLAPAGGPEARALIQVEDGQGSGLPMQELRVVMLDSERSFLLQTLNLMSNDRQGGTVIYNGREITYDVGIRLRGSAAGRARDGTNYQGFNIAFPADQPFRGVHASIAIDRSQRGPVVLRPDEIYVKHMFNRAGVPCMYDDLVHVIGPSPTYTGRALLIMAGYGSVFTSSQFENGERGSVYSPAATYDPATTTGGVEGLKLPVPFLDIRSDFTDLGDSEENYRTLHELRTGRRRDDFASLIEFCKTMSLPGPQLEARIEKIMDVDEWMRYAALTMLCGIGDTYVGGCLPCNIRVYAPPEGGGKVVALPWDNDFVFNRSTTHSLLPDSSNLRRVIDRPKYRRLYWGHVQDLVQRTFNAAYMSDWLVHYGAVMGANLEGQVSYISARGNFALGQLPAQVPFRITTNGGADFSVSGTLAVLQGEGWINAREFRLAGSSATLTVDWLDADTWRLEVPVLPGANPIDLEVYDFGGNRIHTANLVVTSTASAPQPVDVLRITELHLEIGGAMFTDGITFTVPPAVLLEPGAFALVVRNRAAFEALYGPGLPILGEYLPDNLGNEGERLELRDGSGNVIHAFSFSDAWYPATDGGGYSLVVADETAHVAQWNTAAGWGISLAPGGNPNAPSTEFSVQFEGWQREHFTDEEIDRPAVSGPLGDVNSDGIANLLHYAAGESPWFAPLPGPLASVEVAGDRLRLRVRRARNAVDLTIAAEFGSTLHDWSPVLVPFGDPIDNGDGTETLVYEDQVGLPVASPRFGRVRVTLASP